MAATASKGSIAGAYHLQVAFRDDDGYPMGTDTTPDVVSNNATTHAYYVGGLDKLTGATPTIDVAINKGGQKVVSKTPLGIADWGTPGIVLSEFNEVLNAYIKGATADVTTMTEWVQSPANVNQLDFPRMVILVAAKFTHSSDLTDYYLNWVFHNGQWNETAPAGTSQEPGVNPNPSGYQLDLSLSTRNGATGRPFSASSGVYVVGAADTYTRIRSRYPLSITTYVDDGSTGSFVLGYRPVYTDNTGAATNSITKNGTTTAVTSVTVATGAVVITPGSATDRWVVCYPTQFTAI